MDLILIEGLELSCIVGVRPFERRRPQPIRLDLTLGLDLSAAGRTGRIAHTCDYDRVAEEVRAILRFREYQLIEMATEELAAMLFAVHRALVQVEIRLDKPAALHGHAHSAGVRVRRQREQFDAAPEPRPFGTVVPLMESSEAGLYLVNIAPGKRLSPPAGHSLRVLQWVVSGELYDGEQPWGPSDPIGPPGLGLRAHDNVGAQDASLFCCTTPAWSRR